MLQPDRVCAVIIWCQIQGVAEGIDRARYLPTVFSFQCIHLQSTPQQDKVTMISQSKTYGTADKIKMISQSQTSGIADTYLYLSACPAHLLWHNAPARQGLQWSANARHVVLLKVPAR